MERWTTRLLMLWVVAAAIFTLGSRAACAETAYSAADRLHPHAIRDGKVGLKGSPVARAHVQKTGWIKSKKETKKYLESIVKEGAAASENSGKGGAK